MPLVDYEFENDEATNVPEPEAKDHEEKQKTSLVKAAPSVNVDDVVDVRGVYPRNLKERIDYNVPYEVMYAKEAGPLTTKSMHDVRIGATSSGKSGSEMVQGRKQILTGQVESESMSAFDFERQRLTYNQRGYALNPSVSAVVEAGSGGFHSDAAGAYVGDVARAAQERGKSVGELSRQDTAGLFKRRKEAGDSADIDNYQGPWAGYEGENAGQGAVPVGITEEQRQLYQKMLAEAGGSMRQRRRKRPNMAPTSEDSTSTIFHGKSEKDYLGRTYMSIPTDVDVRLDADPESRLDSFPPKRCIYTYKAAHNKGVSAIRLFPRSGHLLLSAGLDGKARLWDVYHDRALLRSFLGHSKAIRDTNFDASGAHLVTASYDKNIRVWDTETGACINSFQTGYMPFCAKFHPDPEKAHLFLAGYANKKIVQWDSRSGKIVQEYDQHLDAVNSVTFIDGNKRFVSTSDDKSIRVWEFDIPVVVKYIAEPHMHSMPAVEASPDGKWVVFQGMDNVLSVYSAHDKFRINRKKRFVGHMVAGYACQPCFSPDSQYLASGDGDGKLNIWEWKSGKMVSKLKAHDKVVIGCQWHPQELSKMITCSWDGNIKIWD